MPTFLRRISLGILLMVGVSRVASADPILITDARALGALAVVSAVEPVSAGTQPSAPFAPLDGVTTATVAEGGAVGKSTATQRSTVSPTRLTAYGAVESFATIPNGGTAAFASADNVFDITFDLPSAYRFALSAVTGGTAFQSNGEPQELDLFLLSKDPASEPETAIVEMHGTATLRNRTGVLPAGSHRLYAEAYTESVAALEDGSPVGPLSHHRLSFDLDFQLTPVPEPGSMVLLSSGLVAFATRRARLRGTFRRNEAARAQGNSALEN